MRLHGLRLTIQHARVHVHRTAIHVHTTLACRIQRSLTRLPPPPPRHPFEAAKQYGIKSRAPRNDQATRTGNLFTPAMTARHPQPPVHHGLHEGRRGGREQPSGATNRKVRGRRRPSARPTTGRVNAARGVTRSTRRHRSWLPDRALSPRMPPMTNGSLARHENDTGLRPADAAMCAPSWVAGTRPAHRDPLARAAAAHLPGNDEGPLTRRTRHGEPVRSTRRPTPAGTPGPHAGYSPGRQDVTPQQREAAPWRPARRD
ncbi:hypothetical protein FrEUN1fDRAFT_7684 [Parafrankia sp. EUN1f]|nr:hypothetical protein FrEUN1fDRAFT_7684 [Parafrankia sp. EUN1f]